MINFLKKFYSLGLNKDGLSLWICQRISAFFMIFLFFCIFFSFQDLSINLITDFNTWIKIPINLIFFITLFIVVIHHSTLGMLNIFEDYVQSQKRKNFFSILLKTISFLIIFISIFSVWHIYSEII